jgi:large subunit ribosomal protein L19e
MDKKELAKRTFKVGKDRIVFVRSRMDDINEAITKQDLRDLKEQGAIIIKEIKGRRKIKKKKRRGQGSIKKRVKKRKKKYVRLVRKLRSYLALVKKQGNISKEDYKILRKKIRNSEFKSISSLKSYIKKEIKLEKLKENEGSKKKKKRK